MSEPIKVTMKPELDSDTLPLSYEIAETVQDLVDCWFLVYRVYAEAGLIPTNSSGIHTYPQVLDNDFIVARACYGQQTVSTLTAYLDGEGGLPLDAVYQDELDQLRSEGVTLTELGLFADRREHLFRSIPSLLELMRYNTYFGLHRGIRNAVVGVHPRHVAFYRRYLGFDVVGKTKDYPLVNHHPVVLLRLDWDKQLAKSRLASGIQYLLDTPVEPTAYDRRCVLSPVNMAGTPIESFFSDAVTLHRQAG